MEKHMSEYEDYWGHPVHGPNGKDGKSKPVAPHQVHREGFNLQGYNKGLANERASRGFMLFGLTCPGDAETRINAQDWLNGFYHGMLDYGASLGRASYDEWEEAFLSVADANGVWSREEILKYSSWTMLDAWADGKEPAAVYSKVIRPEREQEAAKALSR
jgi:hypothetical protein